MKKLVLLLSVIALLIIATGAVSAAKPAPDTFTITGYTTNILMPSTEHYPMVHVVSRVGAECGARCRQTTPFCEALLGKALPGQL